MGKELIDEESDILRKELGEKQFRLALIEKLSEVADQHGGLPSCVVMDMEAAVRKLIDERNAHAISEGNKGIKEKVLDFVRDLCVTPKEKAAWNAILLNHEILAEIQKLNGSTEYEKRGFNYKVVMRIIGLLWDKRIYTFENKAKVARELGYEGKQNYFTRPLNDEVEINLTENIDLLFPKQKSI